MSRALPAVLVLALATSPCLQAAGTPHDTTARVEAALARLRSEPSTSPDSLARFLAEAGGTDTELLGRILIAESAYRSQNLALARQALATADLESRVDFVSGYGCFLSGLIDPGGGLAQFARAYERAGDSLLRHRAALWMAEALRSQGDDNAALRLLEVLPEPHLAEAQRADLLIRRLLLLDNLARGSEAKGLASIVVREFTALADQEEIGPLLAIARQRLGGALTLEGPTRSARVQSLIAARRFRAAAAEARQMVARGEMKTDSDRLLVAEAELRGGGAEQALRIASAIRASRPLGSQARLVEARALLRMRQARRAENLLRTLAADATAGPVRFEAASLLADRLHDLEAETADRLRQFLVGAAPPGDSVDDAAWQLGWTRYLRGDMAGATHWFGRLVERTEQPVHVARGTYWAARAQEHLGRKEEATGLYHEALRVEPHAYYGLSARARLSQVEPPSLPGAPLDPWVVAPADPLQAGASGVLHALQPARELLSLGLIEDALAETRFQARRFPGHPAPRALLAEVLDRSGDYQKSVLAVRSAFPDINQSGVPDGYWSRLYPLTYWGAIQSAARTNALDPYLIAAVLYQESRFKPNAHSGAGAVGLMQIMPGTGRDIARQLGEPRYTVAKLLEPETNIRFGAFFLRQLLERLDHSAVLALAAYNAGPGRVARWRSNAQWDEFVESIPFRETRLYVKKILVAHADYHTIYDAEPKCSLTH